MGMKHPLMICCALLALSLAGCSSRHDLVQVQPAGATKLIQPVDAAELLAAGRGFLAQQNYGLAIAQFREALRFDTSSSAANNGLGIAYASIGRDDLARRYFERAIAFAPDNPSYRRNLDRFAAAGAVDSANAAELAIREQSLERQDDAPNGYFLRQEASSPADRSNHAGLTIPLVAPTNIATLNGPNLISGRNGVALVTKPASVPAAAAAPVVQAVAAPFVLERRRSADRPAAVVQALKRISRYEVRLTVVRQSDVLAQIMKRDYRAQWEAPDGRAPAALDSSLTGENAFRQAIAGVRKRIEASASIAMTDRACARARLISYRFSGPVRGTAQCSS